jgi:hypothetical protein
MLLMAVSANAQEMQTLEGDDNLEVVFGVVLIIVLGMFTYLFYIDKKVSKVEARLKDIDRK